MGVEDRLAGKAALITGGSRGIGAEIARRLAAEGADIAFTYHTGQDEAQAVSEQVGRRGRAARAIQAVHSGQQRRDHLLGAAGGYPAGGLRPPRRRQRPCPVPDDPGRCGPPP
jgi:NAD(P)-dependent dehydrogenase (short-subunit alcohol dehydrogenase family)